MNQDVGELFGRLKNQDPWMLGGAVGLVVSLILAIVLGRAALSANAERRELADQYNANTLNIQQVKAMQEASPEGLKKSLAATQTQLDELMLGLPSGEQVSEELVNFYAYANALDTRLVRLEKTVPSLSPGDEAVFESDLFLMEVHGEIPDLMRFLGQVGSGPYRTFMLDQINIGPDGPAMAEVDLTVYSSDYRAGMSEPITPTLDVTPVVPAEGNLSRTEPAGDVAHLWSLHGDALAAENWALVVASGRQLLKAGVERDEVAETLYLGHLHWAEELAKEGQADEAMAEYRAALAIRPDDAEARQALETLEDKVVPTTELEAGPVPLVIRATAVPTPTEVVATVTPAVHRVRSGESLLYLANRYHTTVSAIKTANGLQGNVIYIGQELVIPTVADGE